MTVADKPGDDLPAGTLNSILKQAGTQVVKERMMHRFLIVFEKAEGNWAAYSPDLPGCVATASSREEAEANMHEAVKFHVEGLREEGYDVPEGDSYAEVFAVS